MLVASGSIAVIIARDTRLVTSPREHWITFVPDDTFYYLGLGSGFATAGHWSLDGGLSTSSGFQVLQGYLSAGCWAAFHRFGADAPVFALTAASVFFAVLALAILLRDLARAFGDAAAAGPALVFLTPSALVCAASGMEWSLTVLSLVLAAGVAANGASCSKVVAACAGCFSALCRFDAVLWVVTLAFAATLAHRRRGLSNRICLAAGALGGALIVACHTHAITGEWLQDSALAKIHWARFTGWDLRGALSTLSRTMPIRALGVDIGVPLYGVTVIAAALAGRNSAPDQRAWLWGASAVMLTAPLVYARNSGGLQLWYTSAAAASAAVAVGGLCVRVGSPDNPKHRIVLLVCVLVAGVFNVSAAESGIWQNQRTMLHAAEVLRDASDWKSARVGSWNAGIIAYYRGHDIVNLDGLANHDALVASREGRLLPYLRAAGITHVVDFGAMLQRSELRKRGGYDVPETQSYLSEVLRAPPTDPLWLDSPLVYWEVASPRSACVR